VDEDGLVVRWESRRPALLRLPAPADRLVGAVCFLIGALLLPERTEEAG
jgi:hypothetical protein